MQNTRKHHIYHRGVIGYDDVLFIRVYVTSLSMSPAAVPAVRYALRHTRLAQCREMAEAAIAAPDPAAAVAAVLALLDRQVREAIVVN